MNTTAKLAEKAKQALACMRGLQQHLGQSVCEVESQELAAALAAHEQAQAERVGLTDEQIAEGRYLTWAAEPDDAPEAWSFMRGARWAEKHFGIGATTGKEPGNV